jgi:hypothetical protein
MCNNHKGLCLYLLIGLNVYLGLLVEVDGATSISTILLVDVKVESFPPYKYVPTPWAKNTKTTIRGASSLGNLSCSKLDISPPSCVAPRPRPFRWMEIEDEVFTVLSLVRNIFIVSSS